MRVYKHSKRVIYATTYSRYKKFCLLTIQQDTYAAEPEVFVLKQLFQERIEILKIFGEQTSHLLSDLHAELTVFDIKKRRYVIRSTILQCLYTVMSHCKNDRLLHCYTDRNMQHHAKLCLECCNGSKLERLGRQLCDRTEVFCSKCTVQIQRPVTPFPIFQKKTSLLYI